MNGTPALNDALAAAQGEFPPIGKDHRAEIKTDKGTYSYAYAPLDVILAAVRPVLSKHGLAIVQQIEDRLDDVGDDRLPVFVTCLVTELRHSSGESIRASFAIPGGLPENPQRAGSALTYFKRYALQAMLGIAAEEDDDGARAAEGGDKKDKPAKPKLITAPTARKIGEMLEHLNEKATPTEGQLSWEGRMREEFKIETLKGITQTKAGAIIAWLKKQAEEAEIPF